jgi:inner membrane transporter RhtA
VQLGAAVATDPIDDVGPLGAALLRNLLAAPMLLLVFPPRERQAIRRSLPLVALLGLSLAAMNSAIYAAIDRIDLGIAVTIEFLGPLGVAVAAARGPRALAWVGLAAAGVVLLAGPGGEAPDAAGIAFAAVAGAGWAAYIVVGQRVGTAFGGASGLTVAVAIAAALLLVPGIATGGSDLTASETIMAALAVAVLSTAIPYSAEIEALRWIPAGTFGVLMSLEPAVAALVGLIALGQGLAAAEVAGIACVVIASAGAVWAAGPAPSVFCFGISLPRGSR